MTGALAPFSYLVIKNKKKWCRQTMIFYQFETTNELPWSYLNPGRPAAARGRSHKTILELIY
jgi:hypothetical protein